MRTSVIIILFFVLGILSGLFSLIPQHFLEKDYSEYALYFLMFFVGISIGASKDVLRIIRAVKVKILLVPASVIIGSLLGVMFVSVFLPQTNIREALAIGAGFGYYSLSSIYISQYYGDIAGVTALISNLLREIITLLGAPLLARYFGKLAPIAAGGATAMDTTLPIITLSSGKDYAMIAVFSGVVLTLLVPVLLSIILSI